MSWFSGLIGKFVSCELLKFVKTWLVCSHTNNENAVTSVCDDKILSSFYRVKVWVELG